MLWGSTCNQSPINPSPSDMQKPNQKRPNPQKNQPASLHVRTRGDVSEATVKPKTKPEFGWVSLFTLSITVFTAVLYGAGKAYRQAYLLPFGLTDALLPWPFQDVVYLGITQQLSILLAAPMVALTILTCLLVLIGTVIWARRRLPMQRTPSYSENKSLNSSANADSILDASSFVLYSLCSIIAVSLLALFYIARAERLGGVDPPASE